MKNQIVIRLLPILLFSAVSTALAEPEQKKEIVIRRHAGTGEGPHFNMKLDGPGPAEMEKVAYLGVETMPVDPTVAAQLNLPKGTGVVIRRVADGSPAASLLKEHDILTKLDDQILVNMAQLTVLVRNHRVGDEVTLSYVRGGKESTVKVKLGEREVPKMAWEGAPGERVMKFFGHAEPGAGASGFGFSHPLPGTPAMPPGEAGDVMRVIGGDRMNWVAQPRVHVIRRHGGAGSTILDLSAGNFVFSDDAGSIEINATEGKRELTVKDKEGKVTYQGPINTPEERAKLPAEVKARVDAIGGAEFGEEPGEIKIETKVLNPARKVHLELPANEEATTSETAMRTL